MNKLSKQYRKSAFYAENLLQYALVPKLFFRRRLESKLKRVKDYDEEEIQRRVNYYNKLSNPFPPNEEFVTVGDLRLGNKNTYIFDASRILRHFDPDSKFGYIFGDTRIVPEVPKIVKSRPISPDNENSVLMRLNQIRHFYFVDDPVSFERKKNSVVWRGKRSSKKGRIDLLNRYGRNPKFDIGDSDSKRCGDPDYKGYLSIKEQLDYRFILSVEGNDVASNLKWVMSSNSLCMMPKPRFETWFMEGTLVPNYHYVLLKDDFSDLEEKMEYYSEHLDEASEILKNAHRYVEPFKDVRQEELVGLMVMRKYFQLSGQG